MKFQVFLRIVEDRLVEVIIKEDVTERKIILIENFME